MGQLIINIPTENESWIYDGIKKRFEYEDNIENSNYDNQIPEDPTTNPSTIVNPQTIEEFTKQIMIEMLSDKSEEGHNNDNMLAVRIIKEGLNIT